MVQHAGNDPPEVNRGDPPALRITFRSYSPYKHPQSWHHAPNTILTFIKKFYTTGNFLLRRSSAVNENAEKQQIADPKLLSPKQLQHYTFASCLLWVFSSEIIFCVSTPKYANNSFTLPFILLECHVLSGCCASFSRPAIRKHSSTDIFLM